MTDTRPSDLVREELPDVELRGGLSAAPTVDDLNEALK